MPRAVTIGMFDGVHLGHQRILRTLSEMARQGGHSACVITFPNHPLTVLAPERAPQLLTTLDEKLTEIDTLGVDECVVIPFTRELASTSAEDFCHKILHSQLHTRLLVIGETSAIGCNREGTPRRLQELCRAAQLEMRIIVVPTVHVMDGIVSSSRIRTALRKGDIDLARQLLGRPYSLNGSVTHGRKLAQRLGFPTINIQVPDEKLLPRYGVYVGYANFGSMRYPMVANIGVRPTVDGCGVSVEAHLLDYQCEQPPERAGLELLFFLRPEQRFENLEALAQQVKRDIASARELLRAQ